MVATDTTATIEHHTRRINIIDGPSLTTRKSRVHKKRTFKVTSLTLTWYGDVGPEHVTAHGHYMKDQKMINCRKVYEVSEAPKWIKEMING